MCRLHEFWSQQLNLYQHLSGKMDENSTCKTNIKLRLTGQDLIKVRNFKIREFGQQLGTKLIKFSFLPIHLKKIHYFVMNRSSVQFRPSALVFCYIIDQGATFSVLIIFISDKCFFGQFWALIYDHIIHY